MTRSIAEVECGYMVAGLVGKQLRLVPSSYDCEEGNVIAWLADTGRQRALAVLGYTEAKVVSVKANFTYNDGTL